MKTIPAFLRVAVPLGLALLVVLLWQHHRSEPAQSPSHGNGESASGFISETAKRRNSETANLVSEPQRGAESASANPQSAIRNPQSPLACDAFDQWVQNFAAAPAGVQAALLAEGERLARARRQEMLELIQQDPEYALARALPYRLRKTLPPTVAALVEQPVQGVGEFKVIQTLSPHAGHDHDAEARQYLVTLDKVQYTGYTYGARTHHPSRKNVPLHGITLTDDHGRRHLALSADALRPLDPDEAAEIANPKSETRNPKPANSTTCPVCAAPVPPGTGHWAQMGGQLLAFDTAAHLAQYNAQANAALARYWPSPPVVQPSGLPEPDPQIEVQEAARMAAPQFMTAASAPAPPLAPGQQLPALPPPGHTGGAKGIFRLLYIPVLFADDPVPPQSQDAAQATCANNARIYKENSYGAVDWITDVTPLVRLPHRKAAYADGIAGGTPVSVVGDALAAARALGYTDAYDDLYVLFNSLNPVVTFGGRSDSLLNGSPGALAHEIGHSTFGWTHANYIDLSGTNPGPPNNNYPADPDSAIGHDDLNAPLPLPIRRPQMVVYGDPYDIMGGGGGAFNVIFKNTVNWLTDDHVLTPTASGTNRLWAFDVPRIFPGRYYALRLRKDYDREYWLSHRAAVTSNPWLSHGVFVQWKSAAQPGNTLLVDTTFASFNRRNDCAVTVGRTLADPPAHIYITPVAVSEGSGTNKWLDVVVNFGPFPTNEPPTVSLSASALHVAPGDPVTLTATARDPNGDVLAYHWDFGDQSLGANQPVQTHAWADPGNYVVRCEVSDMKGGFASAYVVVTVGQPNTYTLSGRVVDIYGNPLQGVRVHNGVSLPANPPVPEEGYGGDPVPVDPTAHRATYTDSQGYYTIGNIPPGTYRPRAFLFGYRMENQFSDPVDITAASASDINFVATPITRVKVERLSDAPEIGQPEPGVTNAGWFRITREGDLSNDLLVRYRTDGTAVIGSDYLYWDGNWWTNVIIRVIGGVRVTNIVIAPSNIGRVTIPAGESYVDMPVVANPNDTGDGNRSVIFTLLYQTNDLRITSYLTNVLTTNWVTTNDFFLITNTEIHYLTNYVSIPGWELLPTPPTNGLVWFQTDPTYIPVNTEATLYILDDDPPNRPAVRVQAIGEVASETYNGPGMFLFTRNNAPVTEELKIHFTVSGTATRDLDYVLPPSPVTIRPGETFALLPVRALSDKFVEGDETVTVTITEDPAYSGGGSATVVILDDHLPRVTIYASDSVAAKVGNNPGRVTVSRTGDLTEPLAVSYLVSGTAVSGRDFQPLPQQITIPAGSITADVFIVPVNNPVPGARTVTLSLADTPSYNIEYQNSATVTILDDLPTVTLQAGGNLSEGGQTTFTVTRTGSTETSLLVFFEVGGSAVEGSDYAAIGTNVLIAAGSATATITISARNANDDAWREYGDRFGDETIILRLRPGPDYNVGSPSSATVRIGDNDAGRWPQVGFMTRETVVREGSFVPVLVKCSANPAENLPINFDFRVVGGTAVEGVNYDVERWMLTNSILVAWGPNGIETNSVPLYWVGRFGHYTPPDPSPEFLNPEDTIGFIPVIIYDDGVAAGNKTLTLRLFPPSGYVTNFPIVTNVTAGVTNVFTNTIVTRLVTNAVFGDYLTHTITIVDVGTTLVSVRADVPTAFEEGLRPGRFILTRNGPLSNALTVTYGVTGTAAPGNDYVSLTTTGRLGTVTIPAGTNQVALEVVPLDDPEEELPETVVLTLLEQPGYALSGAVATVTLISDDGTIQFSRPTFQVFENEGPAVITVLRTGGTNRTTTVDYTLANGTALWGLDYLGVGGTLVFLPGETSKTFPVTLVDDPFVEPDETVLLALVNPTGGVPLGGQNTATLVILNDDAEIHFSTNLFAVGENAGNALITLRREGLTNSVVSVQFTTANLTASNGLDYTAVSTRVEFAAGETTRTVAVPLLDDVLFEGDETVLLRLSAPAGSVSLGTNALLAILDDECTLTFSTNAFFALEYLPFAEVVVQRLGGAVNPVRVDYFTVDGLASNRFDYEAVSGTLAFRGHEWVVATDGSGQVSFRPGDTNLVIYVPLLDDVEGEGSESFSVVLHNLRGPANALPGATLLGPVTNAAVTIVDNEMPGHVDYEFRDPSQAAPGADGPVYALALQPDGMVVFGGDFTNVNGLLYHRVSRLQSVGVVDPAFNPGLGANGPVYAVAVAPDNRVLLGGAFTRYNNTNRLGLARLNANGGLDLTFDPGLGATNGLVRAVAVQADGRVVAGGEFAQMGGLARSNLARLHVNGAVDTTFNPTANGAVLALALQPDGRILVGGAFTRLNGAGYVSLARLTTNGLLDPTFSAAAGFSGPVYAIALQPDGRIVVGGAFTAGNGVYRNLVRLNADGTVDTTFAPGAGPLGAVYAVGVHAGGRIYIGGSFTHYNGTPRSGFARLLPSGALDFVFNPGSGANAPVRALAVQPDTALVIGGEFTVVNDLPRHRIARIHGDEKSNLIGVEFAASVFRVPENAGPARVQILRSGHTNAGFQITFATRGGTASNGLDYVGLTNLITFAPGQMSAEVAIPILDDTLIEGAETVGLLLLNPPRLVELGANATATLIIEDDENSVRFSQRRYHVLESATNAVIEILREGDLSGEVTVRFNTEDGSATAGLDYGAVNALLRFAPGETNKVILIPIEHDAEPEVMETVTLRLSEPQGAYLAEPWLAKLIIQDSTLGVGAPDPAFDPGEGAGSLVRALALMPEARVLVGGAFTTFGLAQQSYVTRLNYDGSLDSSFALAAGANGFVASLGSTPDGGAVLAGAFTALDGRPANRVGRLRPDGAVEPLFNPTNKLNAGVAAVAVQPDGRILVVGHFTEPAPGVARLRADGGVDVSFDPGTGANGPVHAVALGLMEPVVQPSWLPGGQRPAPQVVIGGAFTSVNGFARRYLARLQPNGEVDPAFVPAPISNGWVYAVAVDAQGRVLLGGGFTHVAGLPRAGVARLLPDGALDLAFDPGTGANGAVYALAVQPNGKILLGGEFTRFNDLPRQRIARLLPDGAVDPDFDTAQGADGTVYAILVLPDNKIMIGGSFATVAGLPTRGVARLLGDPPPPLQVTGEFVGEVWRVRINSRPQATYVLEASEDLVTWVRLAQAQATGYVLEMADPTGLHARGKFYRVGRLAP